MALHMLYYSKFKPESLDRLAELRNQFKVLYQEHEIEISGFWENEADTTELHYMAKYEDEMDYKRKAEILKADETYQKLTSELGEIRESFKATRLTPIE
ncbi:MAG: hypothetical protein ACW98Y_20895 [Candidatus Thorarchaeota archaeon]|jgi:hypothetical protein